MNTSFLNQLISIFTFVVISAFADTNIDAQARQDHFTAMIREESGDLNGDGLEDKAIISMDSSQITRTLRLEIFFKRKDQKDQLILSAIKLLEPQYSINGEYLGNVLPDVEINNGILTILTERNGNHSQYCFKFNHGNFELIRYSNVIWDGKNTTTETQFDLLTGNYSVESQQLGSDKVTILEKRNKIIKPLPKIQEFSLYEHKAF